MSGAGDTPVPEGDEEDDEEEEDDEAPPDGFDGPPCAPSSKHAKKIKSKMSSLVSVAFVLISLMISC